MRASLPPAGLPRPRHSFRLERRQDAGDAGVAEPTLEIHPAAAVVAEAEAGHAAAEPRRRAEAGSSGDGVARTRAAPPRAGPIATAPRRRWRGRPGAAAGRRAACSNQVNASAARPRSRCRRRRGCSAAPRSVGAQPQRAQIGIQPPPAGGRAPRSRLPAFCQAAAELRGRAPSPARSRPVAASVSPSLGQQVGEVGVQRRVVRRQFQRARIAGAGGGAGRRRRAAGCRARCAAPGSSGRAPPAPRAARCLVATSISSR